MFDNSTPGKSEEKTKEDVEMESDQEKKSEIHELYRGVWADKLDAGQMLPVGGSIFSKEMTTFLELDFDAFEKDLSTLNPQRLQEVLELTGKDSIVEYLDKLKSDIDPLLFFACLQAQKKMAGILKTTDAEPGNSFERMKKYGGETAPKLSELIGKTECAERAAMGQYVLQKIGIQSSYMSGIVMNNPEDNEECPESHSFLVVKDGNQKQYVFDIARPHNNEIPRIYSLKQEINEETFKNQEDLLIEGDDIFTHAKLWLGVGDPAAGHHSKMIEREVDLDNLEVKKEIIKKMELPVEKKMEMVLLLTQKKPTTDLQFCSETWLEGQEEKDIDRRQIQKLLDDLQLLNLTGRIELDELNEVTERDDEGKETVKQRRIMEIFVAKNEEALVKMKKAREEGNHSVIGEMYGFPQSAREAFSDNSRGFFRSQLPVELRKEEWYPYITFGVLSRDNWQEEIEIAKGWMEAVKQFDGELHREYINWARTEWLADELGE